MEQTIQIIARKARRITITNAHVPINEFRLNQLIEALNTDGVKTVHFIRQEYTVSKRGNRSISAEYYLNIKRTLKYIQLNGHYLSHKEFNEVIETLAEKEIFMNELDIVKELMWRFK